MEILKTSWPGVYSANFIEQGLVSYEDSDDGILYVPKEALDRMLASFIGKPVCIKHQKITPENYEELRKSGVIVGNVIRTWFNANDGWFWCDFLVDTAEGRKRIDENKDSVSCAYVVSDAKEGGIWHDIKYDGELIDGSFTHLALVDSPRYEGAKITKQLPMLMVNEKTAITYKNKEDYMSLKDMFFRKKTDGTKEKLDNIVIAMNGKDIDLGEFLETLVEKVNETHKGIGGLEGIKMMDDDMVTINGKKYKFADIKANVKPENEKKNCNCNAKDGEDHGKECPMYKENGLKEDEEKLKAEEDKENARIKAKAVANGKSEEEIIEEERAEKEKKNSLKSAEQKKIEDLELENARLKKEKEGQEFYNQLETLANSNLPIEEDGGGSSGLSREERANRKSKQIKKQFAAV